MFEPDKTELVNESPEESKKPEQNESRPARIPRGMTLIVLTAVIFSAAVTVALILSILFGEGQVHPIGSVAADSTNASECGLQMLKLGGTAVDAAVAAAMCSAVVQFHHTGLGGGGLMLVHQHRTDSTILFDFRESAPSSASPNMFGGSNSRALYTGLGTAVPGFVLGLSEAHKKFGQLTWRQVLSPAIKLADNGFRVDSRLFQQVSDNVNRLQSNANLSKIYLTESNRPKPIGSLIIRPDLAAVLRQLSDNPLAIYSGELAAEFVRVVNDNGGNFTLTDMSGYSVRRPRFLVGHFFNYTVRTFPAPASGGPMLLLVANAMTAMGRPTSTAVHYHRLAELLKFGYAEATQLGDTGNSLKRQSRMISADFAKLVAKSVSDNHVFSNSTSDYSKFLPLMPNGTAQVSAVDNQEMYVSMTTSLHGTFGSFITTPSGILLNNQMAAFSITDGQPPDNRPAPGKRPVSLMSPAFVFNPRQRCALRFALGASNNTQVPAAVANVLSSLALIEQQKCPQVVSRGDNERQACLPVDNAVKAPRVSAKFDALGPFVEFESGGPVTLASGIVDSLRARGQRLVPNSRGIGVAEVVAMDMYSLIGVSDSWRSGAEAKSLS